MAFANPGVVDAIIDGTTGRLAPDGSDEGLCAILSTLSRDRAGRDDLGRWARIHAEAAWSLEACYRSLFQVLRRQGIVDRLGLPHKIGFRPDACGGQVRALADAALGWTPVSGVGREEGPYPEAGMTTRFRWLHHPECRLDLRAETSGPHVVALRFQNRLFAEQTIRVAIDGTEVADLALDHRSGEDFDVFVLERYLTRGPHRMSLTFGHGLDEGPAANRVLALRLDSVAIFPKASAGPAARAAAGEG